MRRSLSSSSNLGWYGAAALFVVASLVFGLGTGNPNVTRWLAVYVGAALAVGVFVVHLWRTHTVTLTRLDMAALAFLGYAGLSLLWSSDWGEGMIRWHNMAALVVIGLWASRSDRERLTRYLPQAAFAAVILALVLAVITRHFFKADTIWAFGGFGNENWQAEWLIMALPFCVAALVSVAMRDRIIVTGTTLAALGYLFIVNDSDVKWAVIAGLLLAVVIWMIVNRWWVAALVVTLVPINVAVWSGFAFSEGVLASLGFRLELGFNTAVLWFERPFFGYGLGSFNYEYARVQEAHVAVFPWLDTLLRPLTNFAGAAHNEALQLLAVMGAVGAALAVTFLWLLWRNINRSMGHCRIYHWDALDHAALFSLGFGAVLSGIGFPLQNPATALLVALSLGILAQGAPARFTIALPRFTRAPAALMGTACAAALLSSGGLAYAAERHLHQTRLWSTAKPLLAFQENLAAYRLYPLDRAARHQLGLSLMQLLTRYETQVVLDDDAADQIYRIGQTAARHAPALLLARAEYLINAERWDDSDEIEDILAELRGNASLQAATWLTEAYYARLLGDVPRMVAAIERGVRVPDRAIYRDQMTDLAQAVLEPQ